MFMLKCSIIRQGKFIYMYIGHFTHYGNVLYTERNSNIHKLKARKMKTVINELFKRV